MKTREWWSDDAAAVCALLFINQECMMPIKANSNAAVNRIPTLAHRIEVV